VDDSSQVSLPSTLRYIVDVSAAKVILFHYEKLHIDNTKVVSSLMDLQLMMLLMEYLLFDDVVIYLSR